MTARGDSDFELTELLTAFDQLADPRSSINRLPPLSSVLSIAVPAVLCGDAMGVQTAIVKDIVDRKGDVIICLKGNQGNLYNPVSDFVDNQIESGFSELHHEELHEPAKKKWHGRLESGTSIHFAIPKEFPIDEKWVGIKSIGVVVRETISAGKDSVERSFTFSSLPVNVTQFAESVRSHWGIENSCHWSLDVNWREDALRTMERRMAENPA